MLKNFVEVINQNFPLETTEISIGKETGDSYVLKDKGQLAKIVRL